MPIFKKIKLGVRSKIFAASLVIALMLLLSGGMAFFEFGRMSRYISEFISNSILSVDLTRNLLNTSERYHSDLFRQIGGDGLLAQPETIPDDEFESVMDRLYTVLASEGPGQGAALRKSGLTFTPEWEKPVGAVLDHYGAEDVTIIGVSLGGELCMRAAAMEPRIRRVVSWSVLPSIYGALMADKPAEIRAKLEHWLDENNRDAILDLYAGLAEREPLFRWSIQHSNYAYGTSDVYEYLQKARAFTIEPVAERITQDVLLLSAREDLLVDFALYKQEIDLLKNTRSLEFAAPGRALNGQAHCNMGNTKYMLDLILNWNDRMLER